MSIKPYIYGLVVVVTAVVVTPSPVGCISVVVDGSVADGSVADGSGVVISERPGSQLLTDNPSLSNTDNLTASTWNCRN